MTEWRVVPLETHDAYTNMAIDEAVSEGVSESDGRLRSPPTVRFYRWKPSAASIGYFQSLRDEVDVERCDEDGVDYVRRRTGGGAVYHDYEGEVTYSVVGPVECFPDDLTESYRQICGRVIDALSELGIDSEFEPVNDIVTDGKKVSGNAQTRRKGVLLQHGTVLHDVDPEEMFTYLRPEVDKVSDKVVESVRERVTSVVDERGGGSVDETYEALRTAFETGRETYEGGLTDEELDRAHELVGERYSSDGWNFMK
ncbi:MAG: biotin/lipoate A/B protein ligase family protein [Halobacteria archaeon]|nr:biotin/lipoate A/B protein ligase family protein [Halobacteria archaeon]